MQLISCALLAIFLIINATSSEVFMSTAYRSLPAACCRQSYAANFNFLWATVLRALMVMSYKASLNANKKAAVMTLWVTLGPIPVYHVSLL